MVTLNHLPSTRHGPIITFLSLHVWRVQRLSKLPEFCSYSVISPPILRKSNKKISHNSENRCMTNNSSLSRERLLLDAVLSIPCSLGSLSPFTINKAFDIHSTPSWD